MTGAIHQRYRPTVILVLATLLLAIVLGALLGPIDSTTSSTWDGGSSTEHPRRRLSNFADPNSVMQKLPLTVYLTYAPAEHRESRFLEQHTFARYTTGRINYNIVKHGRMVPTNDTGPCLTLSSVANAKENWEDKEQVYKQVKSYYPNCKTMVSNDEQCLAPKGYDVRQYFSVDHPGYYLPLGPRHDFYLSWKKIEQRPGFATKPPSKRMYAFNAMFSKSTNCHERCPLAEIVKRVDPSMFTFVAVAERWRPKKPKVDTETYINILLESAFTLSPSGFNPECFRLYEAIEAGSIPVMLKSLKECPDAMRYWWDAPIVFLDTWDDLYPTIKRLMEDPVALDEMIVKLRLWYDRDFMGRRVVGFEDYMIESFPNSAVTGPS